MGDKRDHEKNEKVGNNTVWLLRINGVMPLILCLFVIACYGFYVFGLFQSSLNLLYKYNQYFDLVSTLESLYSFGKFGIVAFAAVESFLLFRYLRSGSIGYKTFVCLLAAVVVLNSLLYGLISYVYGYVRALL